MATFASSECATTCFFDLQGSDARLSEVFQGLGNPVLQSIRDQYGISGSAAPQAHHPTQDNAERSGETPTQEDQPSGSTLTFPSLF
jgi:hypothetical protein